MTDPLPSNKPILIIVLGVAGSGKTTLAKNIANHQNYLFVEGNDFHTDKAIALMTKGVPLDDAIRDSWVRRLHEFLSEKAKKGTSCTLAFSGLKQAHREKIQATGFHTLSIFLNGDKAIIKERLRYRPGHFMPVTLLDSQFDDLELPDSHPDMLSLDVALRPHQQLKESVAFINNKTNLLKEPHTHE